MSLKSLKPLRLPDDATRADGYALFPIADKWAEMLPVRVPLRFSIFRYLGFYVAHTKAGKSSVVRGRPAILSLHVTIQNDDKVVFSNRVATPFRNGVYYVQDIMLDQPGVHKVMVQVEGAIAGKVEPLMLQTQVFEFMTLEECPDLERGPYQPLRRLVLDCEANQQEENLRDDQFQEDSIKQNATALRRMDAKWWLKAYVEHTLDRAARQKQLQLASVVVGRTSHKRKQDHPVRSADKREHDNLFERRRRDWKRVRNGEIRMFTNEPLHANATVTVYSAKEMYNQLSQYAQG